MSSQMFKLNNDYVFILAEAPGSLYNTDQIYKIAQISEKCNSMIRVTEDQRIGLFVTKDHIQEVIDNLKNVGLEYRHYGIGLHQPICCIGAQCINHAQDSLTTSIQLTEMLEGIETELPIQIGINGCSACCVPIHTLDIAAVGTENGYNLYIGGKNSIIPEFAMFVAENIPQDLICQYIIKIINKYKELKQNEETLKDVIDRCGLKVFAELLYPYSQDAVHHDIDNPFSSLDQLKEHVKSTHDFTEYNENENSVPLHTHLSEQENEEIDINMNKNNENIKNNSDILIQIHAEEEPLNIISSSQSQQSINTNNSEQNIESENNSNIDEDIIEQKLNQEIELEESFNKTDINTKVNEDARKTVLDSMINDNTETITNDQLIADLKDFEEEKFDDIDIDSNEDDENDITYLTEKEIIMPEKNNITSINTKEPAQATEDLISSKDATTRSHFKGFKYEQNSILCLFNSGAILKIDLSKIAFNQQLSISFEDNIIFYSKDKEGIKVKVNEIEILYPLAIAA